MVMAQPTSGVAGTTTAAAPAPAEPNAELDAFIRKHQALKAQMAALQADLDALREEYAPKVMAVGNYAGAYGRVEVRAGYTQTSWNTDAVRRVIAQLRDSGHFELAGMLAGAEKKTTVKASFQVK